MHLLVAGKHRVAPLVEEMLSAIEGEMGRYERIITHWSVYGPDLEKCVTSALRDTTIAVSRQCGLINTKVGDASSVLCCLGQGGKLCWGSSWPCLGSGAE